jgi:hypothetical protein
MLITLITFILNSKALVLRSFPQQSLVNSEGTIGSQTYPTIYNLTNNNFVVVWNDAQALTFKMQIYNEVGDKQGANISIISNCYSFKTCIVDLGNNKFAFSCSIAGITQLIIYDYSGTVILGPITGFNLAAHFNYNIAKLDDGSIVLSALSVSYVIYYSIVSQTGNILVQNTIATNGYNRESMVVESFANNQFIICWYEKSTPENILCRIFNALGVQEQAITVDTTLGSIPVNSLGLSIKRTSTDNIVLSFIKKPGSYYTTYLWACNLSGVVIYGPAQIHPCPTSCVAKLHERVTELSNGHIMLIYESADCCSGTQIYMQEFDASLNLVGNRIIVNNYNSMTNSYPDIVGLSRAGFAVIFLTANLVSPTSNNDVYLQIYYGEEISLTCQDITVYVKTSFTYSLADDFKYNISYQYMTDLKVSYLTIPKSGSFQLSTGTTISANTPTDIALYNYKSPDTQDSFTVQYVAVNHWFDQSSTCNLKINVCYPNCETCSGVGNDTNQLCTSCMTGYFSFQSNCYSVCPEQVNGAYLYISGNICNQCVSPCMTCADVTNCKTCLQGYYFVENLSSNNCVQTCPGGYYLVGNLCKQCNSLCSLCIDNPGNCPKCTTSAYYLNPNQCVSECPSGYVPNDSRECVTCKSLNKYFYIDQCVDTCPKGTKDELNKLCNDTEVVIECNSLFLF